MQPGRAAQWQQKEQGSSTEDNLCEPFQVGPRVPEPATQKRRVRDIYIAHGRGQYTCGQINGNTSSRHRQLQGRQGKPHRCQGQAIIRCASLKHDCPSLALYNSVCRKQHEWIIRHIGLGKSCPALELQPNGLRARPCRPDKAPEYRPARCFCRAGRGTNPPGCKHPTNCLDTGAIEIAIVLSLKAAIFAGAFCCALHSAAPARFRAFTHD